MTNVLEHRVNSLEQAFVQTNSALKGIDDSLRKLTALEAHHAQTKDEVQRAFKEIKDHEDRLRAIEAELPQMKLVAKYVIAGGVGVIALVGTAVGKLVL